jgi:hypothetical protein
LSLCEIPQALLRVLRKVSLVIGLSPQCFCTCGVFLFVYILHFDLPNEGGPASSYSLAAHWARPRQTLVKFIFQDGENFI